MNNRRMYKTDIVDIPSMTSAPSGESSLTLIQEESIDYYSVGQGTAFLGRVFDFTSLDTVNGIFIEYDVRGTYDGIGVNNFGYDNYLFLNEQNAAQTDGDTINDLYEWESPKSYMATVEANLTMSTLIRGNAEWGSSLASTFYNINTGWVYVFPDGSGGMRGIASEYKEEEGGLNRIVYTSAKIHYDTTGAITTTDRIDTLGLAVYPGGTYPPPGSIATVKFSTVSAGMAAALQSTTII